MKRYPFRSFLGSVRQNCVTRHEKGFCIPNLTRCTHDVWIRARTVENVVEVLSFVAETRGINLLN
jgi:hypothetical protein